MKYIKVRWLHELENEPVMLLSELDDQSFELRKIELYADGHAGYADSDREVGGTFLGEVPVPSVAEIALDSQFVAEEIDAVEFEAAWKKASA